MSKFTTKIDELLSETGANKAQQKTAGMQAAIAAAKAAELAGKIDPTKKPTPIQKKLLQGLKKATMAAGKQLAKVAMSSNKPKGKVLEAEDEFTPKTGPETGGEFQPASKDDFAQEPEEENSEFQENLKKFVTVKNRKIAYLEEGEGDPIVLIHGNPTSSFLWRNVIPRLASHGRVIAPDLIGHGDSDKLPADDDPDRYSFDVTYQFLSELFLEIGVEENIIFVE